MVPENMNEVYTWKEYQQLQVVLRERYISVLATDRFLDRSFSSFIQSLHSSGYNLVLSRLTLCKNIALYVRFELPSSYFRYILIE